MGPSDSGVIKIPLNRKFDTSKIYTNLFSRMLTLEAVGFVRLSKFAQQISQEQMKCDILNFFSFTQNIHIIVRFSKLYKILES